MGACVSSSSTSSQQFKIVRLRRKGRGRSKKHRVASIADSSRKRNSDCGARVSDFAVGEIVHATTTCRRSEVSSSTFHLTQLQWHHSQIDANGICQEEAWFDTLSILDSDSDDDFNSVHGDFFPNISNGQVLQCDTSSYYVDSNCNIKEYHESYSSKDGVKEPNGSKLVITQGKEPPAPEKSDESASKRLKKPDRCHLNFNGVKDDKSDHEEKVPEKLLKSVLPRIVPSMSFNEKINSVLSAGPQSQRKKSAVIRPLSRENLWMGKKMKLVHQSIFIVPELD